MTNKLTIQIIGGTLSGKTFIRYQIAKKLKKLGLDVEMEPENELTESAVKDRIKNPDKFVDALNERQTKIIIKEVQLNRSEVG